MNDKIITENSIWDLHIHTCCCKKSSSEFSKMTIEEYVNKLVDIFKNYESLRLISFTDHNYISAEVYEEFRNKCKNINLLPGIEVDIYLNEEYKEKNDYKHIIVYFDNTKFKLDTHCSIINEKLKNTPLLLHEFIDFLITKIKVPFLLSPHFIKQGKRAINYDWDEERTKENIDKYIDQMICFWETSNLSNIIKAIDFLKEFDKNEKVSVISFSDSNNTEKLIEYLNNPNQYFAALPTFEGVRMVGSDCRRIKFEKTILTESNKGLYIGKVKQGNNELFLSPKLNVIIGGRGSGKSLLIDGVALVLKKQLTNALTKERLKYLKNMSYEVYDMNENNLKNHNFQIDYFNQGFILNLFDKNENLLENIYFENEFDKLTKFNPEEIRSSIIKDLNYKKKKKEALKDNISSIISKNIIINDSENELQIKKIKEESLIEYVDIEKIKNNIFNSEFIPIQLKDNTIIKTKGLEFIESILSETNKYNDETIKNNLKSKIINKYNDNLDEKNKIRSAKNSLLENIKKQIRRDANEYINRVRLINNLLTIAKNNYSNSDEAKIEGYCNNYFIFKSELNVEKILNYLYNVFNVYFDSSKCKQRINCDKSDSNNLLKLIEGFCYFPEDLLMESKKIENLIDELKTLKSLNINVVNSIYYKEDKKEIINIKNLSPGTKANILMEYIVFKDTKVPLLIDQPEDNIDNKTIYKVLTDWFTTLKNKRQVIVATHDANIVVNGDAENVIICEQKNDNEFVYEYGALETANVLEKISNILDGGNEAIKRRLLKYGE